MKGWRAFLAGLGLLCLGGCQSPPAPAAATPAPLASSTPAPPASVPGPSTPGPRASHTPQGLRPSPGDSSSPALDPQAFKPAWRPFGAPEFEATFPGDFQVTPGGDQFEVRCEAVGHVLSAGWARVQGGADEGAIRGRLEKSGIKVLSCRPGPVGGKPGGLHFGLTLPGGREGEARVVLVEGRLFEALWLGPSPAPDWLEPFWSGFKVH